MKKVVFILMVVLGWGMAAQAPRYVRIDTVYKPYFQFDYRTWLDTDNTHPLLSEGCHISYPNRFSIDTLFIRVDQALFNGDAPQYNYVEQPTDVYGLSLYLPNHSNDTFTPFPPTVQEYLYLYEAEPDTCRLMAQVPLDYDVPVCGSDTFGYWCCRHSSVNNPCTCGEPVLNIINHRFDRRDYYFDKPIRVQDSFYVGFSSNSGKEIFIVLEDTVLPDWPTTYSILSTSGLSIPHNGYIYPDSSCWIRNPMRLHWDPNSSYLNDYLNGTLLYNLRPNEWTYQTVSEFFLVLPIFKVYDTIWTVDTPACTPVWDFRIMSRYDNTVRLRWSHDGTHNEWQLSYGPQGIQPEDGTMVTCHTNTWSYDDTVGELMVAYVRTVCRELDTVRYSEWSEGVEWLVLQGVDQPEVGLPEVVLRPNPAKERVEVVSPAEVKRIEVYDAGGVKWRELPKGTSGFAVDEWPKGTYMVVVHTSAGTVTKRLVVE